jgi:uncharacterized membrane protein
MTKPLGFVKTTAIGGLLFLLPLIVIAAIVGQAVPALLSFASTIGTIVPARGPAGAAGLVAIALGIVVLLCFVAGLVTRRSFGQRFSRWLERNLEILFPRYLVIRERMSETVGDAAGPSLLKPVLVRFDDHHRVAFESDRAGDAVAVFLPASPDPWSGEVVFVAASRVVPLSLDLSDALATCKRMGRDSVTRTLGPTAAVTGA